MKTDHCQRLPREGRSSAADQVEDQLEGCRGAADDLQYSQNVSDIRPGHKVLEGLHSGRPDQKDAADESKQYAQRDAAQVGEEMEHGKSVQEWRLENLSWDQSMKPFPLAQSQLKTF